MFQHIIPLRDKQPADRAPSRLAPAATGATGGAALSPRQTPSRLGGAVSPRTQQQPHQHAQEPVRSRAGALPTFRSRLNRESAGGARRLTLPHVRPAAERLAACYSSLEGLRRITELFKGKHSTVCTYLDTRSGAVVAVKTYYKRTMAKRHFRNVRREVAINRLLARQGFTGAVQLLGAFEDEAHIYLVQESCTGGDLYRRLVRAGGLMAEREVCRDVVVPLLLTLTFLHANHIVHRDIKPENLMFAADGGLRLGDFGLSIDAGRERPTSRVGTLDYMAPEVVGMPSPDEIQRQGLAPHEIGNYGCKVDVWAVGILTYELICGRPPFEVEDVKVTEQHIQFAEVDFPGHVSPACRSFIQQALTKRSASRPTADQLFEHPWCQAHYLGLLAEHAQQPVPAGIVAAAATVLHTPELRRTASQPPSPSKSMPGGATARLAEGDLTPAAVAAALAPFLPLSQAKMAHKVRLLSPGRPASGRAARARRRVSDPLARMLMAPQHTAKPAAAAAPAAEAVTVLGAAGAAEPAAAEPAAGAAAAAAATAPDVPPTTPLQAAVSADSGAVAAGRADAADSLLFNMAPSFETPGTPGLKTTPLPRQRPIPSAQQRGLLGRSPFLLPLSIPGGGSAAGGVSAAEAQPLSSGLRSLGSRGTGAPQRSRFAAGSENDEAQSLRDSLETLSPGLPSRTSSLTTLATGKDSGSSLDLASRSNSFASFGGNSCGNLQLAGRTGSFGGGSSSNLQMAARTASFTSIGNGSSSGILPNLVPARGGSCSPASKPRSRQHLLDGAEVQLAAAAGAAAGEQAAASGEQPVPSLAEQLQRMQLA